MRRYLLIATLLATSMCFVNSVQAGLIGDTVSISYVGAGSSGPNTHTVGAGEEGNFFGNQYYDFDDFTFYIRSTSNFCGIFACGISSVSLILDSLDFPGALTNVSFTTNLSGVSVVWDSDTATFTWTEQSINTGTYLSAVFNSTNTQVPEPATLAIMAVGLVGLGLGRRRRS